jgi:hypothetical protein
VLGDLRERVVAGQQDVGEGLVVAQQHVEARPQALDQVDLEQQRLDLGVGRDDLDRRRLGHHPPQPGRELVDMGVGDDARFRLRALPT